jgi:hypothetical protein
MSECSVSVSVGERGGAVGDRDRDR